MPQPLYELDADTLYADGVLVRPPTRGWSSSTIEAARRAEIATAWRLTLARRKHRLAWGWPDWPD